MNQSTPPTPVRILYLVHAAHVVQEVVLLGVVYGGGRLREKAQHGLHLLLPVLALGDLRKLFAKYIHAYIC